ncbi:IclR family transcriptional regulator [Azospirillum griseum]|uniref:IclR family transcriptional regulator n=2 Tax=Azospirillum griseum TaxID=2496639 RepID=A0A431VMH5_9PROT|nr:IclR family transcriptional regulator [Azospirillum griseum]
MTAPMPHDDADNTDAHAKPAGTQTLLRGLALLEWVAAGVTDVKGIAAKLGTPRSTTHRMLTSLVAEGYLHHIPHKGYRLGSKLIHLGQKALEQRPLVAIARPHLEALAARTGDTIHLGIAEGDEVFYLDKIAGTRGLEMRSRTGQRMPLASTGIGKALMLGLPVARWAGLHTQACPDKATDDAAGPVRPSPPPWPEFAARMADYAAWGWAFDLEENELGIRCVAAPVRDAGGGVVAAISVASAAPYMPDARMRALGPQVRATADAISGALGWNAE